MTETIEQNIDFESWKKKINNEPKDEKEIIKRWRGLGFLEKIPEGCDAERNCALSYELLANYLIENENGDEKNFSYTFCLIPFAIIRRMMYGGERTVNRPLTINDIGEIGEITFDMLKSKYILKNELTNIAKLLNISYTPLKYVELNDEKCKKMLEGINEYFNIDFEGEIVALCDKYFVEKFNKEEK